MDLRGIQRLLAADGAYTGAIDGDFGPKSEGAVEKVLTARKPDALTWSTKRQRIAAAQAILRSLGFEPGTVDGYLGDLTREAFNAWDYRQTYGRGEILPGREVSVPVRTGLLPAGTWPTQAGCESYFGPAGGPRCTAGTVILPIPFRIAWNRSQKIAKFSCHALVAEPLTAIYREAVAHYGAEKFQTLGLDLWGGCYNYRKMRGGSALSMHAYGIAVDHDPERNQLRWGRDRAAFAKPVYDAWWAIVEATGAISLGREANYDWMHFQFARR